MVLDEKSRRKLVGVHPDLVKVVMLAAEKVEDESFIVTEGQRALERQRFLFSQGKSKTMDSRHLSGHAVDLAVWYDRDEDKVVDVDELSWKFPDYEKLASVVLAAAEALGIPIVWGGNWSSLKDGPHFELDRKVYP